MTPSLSDLRRGIALGAGNWAAFLPTATDEEIKSLCLGAYGWREVVIERDAAIARARPRSIENLRRPHPQQKAVDREAAELLVKTNPNGGKHV